MIEQKAKSFVYGRCFDYVIVIQRQDEGKTIIVALGGRDLVDQGCQGRLGPIAFAGLRYRWLATDPKVGLTLVRSHRQRWRNRWRFQ